MDPYKVPRCNTAKQVMMTSSAYRELARKYHPDNYVNNPLADLAETRMKEINEAYDMIMNERRNPAGGSSGQQQSYGGAYNGQQFWRLSAAHLHRCECCAVQSGAAGHQSGQPRHGGGAAAACRRTGCGVVSI